MIEMSEYIVNEVITDIKYDDKDIVLSVGKVPANLHVYVISNVLLCIV